QVKAAVPSSNTYFGVTVAVNELIVDGEYGSLTVFGDNGTMEVTTGTTGTTGTTATTGTQVSTGDVILYTSGTGSITDHTSNASSTTADGSTYSQTNTTKSLTPGSVNSNREESEADGD